VVERPVAAGWARRAVPARYPHHSATRNGVGARDPPVLPRAFAPLGHSVDSARFATTAPPPPRHTNPLKTGAEPAEPRRETSPGGLAPDRTGVGHLRPWSGSRGGKVDEHHVRRVADRSCSTSNSTYRCAAGRTPTPQQSAVGRTVEEVDELATVSFGHHETAITMASHSMTGCSFAQVGGVL